MKKIRFGIVGMGIIGNLHARAIAKARSREFSVTAVADILPDVAAKAGEKYGAPHFDDGVKMYESGLIDAVLIATPHYWHAPLGIEAARRKIHVLCEKPISVAVGPARALIAECKKRRVALGAMLMMRTQAAMAKMKKLVDDGLVGDVFRVEMICSSWYRTQAYYDSGAWRGTWDGEGGGILLNQAPHSLDLFQWIGGMPNRVTAVLATRGHKIEVENTANIICEYGRGKVGYIYATTSELPGSDKLTVVGDKGTLISEGGKLRFGKLSMPISEHLSKCKSAWADDIPSPKCTWRDIKIPAKPDGRHINVTRAFARHIIKGTPLVATGAEAIAELEISNAAYLSGFNGGAVDLPVDAAKIDKLIAKLERERSTGKGGGQRKKAERAMKKLLAK